MVQELSKSTSGGRKYKLGMSFLFGSFTLAITAVFGMIFGDLTWSDMGGLTGVITAISAGLLTIIYGNVQEHKFKNGNGNGHE